LTKKAAANKSIYASRADITQHQQQVRYSALVPADTALLYFYSYFHLLFFKSAAVRADTTLNALPS